MAVAVKTSTGARTPDKPGGLAVLSLLGVVYLVATLAIVFKLLPSLWWSAWEGVGLGSAAFVGAALLAIIELAAIVGLVYGGAKLLGSNPPTGVRAGVFVGFVGLLIILFLTRWAGRWFEDSVFGSGHGMSPQMGAILTGLTGGILLAAFVYGFTRPWSLGTIVKFEEAGWFHATSYKANQGRVVRRGTIVGILVLAGTGIWSLTTGRLLQHGPHDWALSIPFTGAVAVERMGDAREFVQTLPASAKPEVQIKWAGNERDSNVHVDQVVSAEQYRKLVKEALTQAIRTTGVRQDKVQEELREIEKKDKAAQDTLKLVKLQQEAHRWKVQTETLETAKERIDAAADKDVVEFIRTVNQAVHDGYKAVLASSGFHEDITRRLHETDRDTTWDDLSKLLAALKKETADMARGADAVKRVDELGWVVSLPLAIPLVDRAALMDANKKTDKTSNVKLGVRRNRDFLPNVKEGAVVPTSEFDKEEVRVYLAVAQRKLGDNKKDKEALATP